MLVKMYHCCVTIRLFRVLVDSYKHSFNTIVINIMTSTFFSVGRGVHQEVVSTFLYTIYMDELSSNLGKCSVGIKLQNTNRFNLTLADDTCLCHHIACSRCSISAIYIRRNENSNSTHPNVTILVVGQKKNKCVMPSSLPSPNNYSTYTNDSPYNFVGYPLFSHIRLWPWVYFLKLWRTSKYHCSPLSLH